MSTQPVSGTLIFAQGCVLRFDLIVFAILAVPRHPVHMSHSSKDPQPPVVLTVLSTLRSTCRASTYLFTHDPALRSPTA